jgi:hypothetical protein
MFLELDATPPISRFETCDLYVLFLTYEVRSQLFKEFTQVPLQRIDSMLC